MKKKIIINGKKVVFEKNKDICVNDVLVKYSKSLDYKGIAVAVNFDLVIRQDWDSTLINDNDIIEIVAPFPGG